ncbi:tetratricopeptide repeat protein [Rubrivirga sp. S365]|uniref:Tetratricopeptide repeat protein n=1 Tax=Rubrivirga litoralis TaxID=3075598 RepID=A0ABU3BQM7_9BACT|nr:MULTISPECIES: tetratricopeptide repeat protein [unclassified Rubrivirga]MDT0631594.1 tetratricopeptide repeat protein [Rubrivirga sp. F394]MDT7857239.1 tetratricopeptide repeat protein [Rubrivirga sp. S365]
MRLVLLAALLLPALAAAQQGGTVILRDGDRGAVGDQQAYVLALQLLANGRTGEAIPLLEDLVAAEPDALPAWLKLKEAYATARRFDDVLALVDGRIARVGPAPDLLAARGASLYRAGRGGEAEAAWQSALAAAPDEAQTYRTVASALADLRLFVRAAEVLDAGREALGDDDLFRLERAHLYGLGLDYAAAADLYLDLLADEPEYAPAVRSRLTRLLDGDGAPAVFAAAVDAAIARDPLNRAYRELASWLALERGDYDAALDAVRALDRLEGEEGRTLVAFAEQAEAAGAGPAAGAALDEALRRYPNGPVAADALLARARRWDADARDVPRSDGAAPTPAADSARAAYAQFLDRHPARPDAPAAALALANLLRDRFRDYEGAEARLAVAARSRDEAVASAARLALGEVAVRRGDLDAARARFSDVDEGVRVGPVAEQARYELALIDFYEGLVFSALARVEALDENTAADASNDAIALRVTLGETLNQDEPPEADLARLRTYARAALAFRRGLADEALATLDSLDASAPPSSPGADVLGDESLYLRASVLRRAGRAADAVDALDRLAEAYPLSFFRDRALRVQAQALETDLGDRGGAAARWERLLELFPGSLYAPEARLELRRLRAET